MVTNIVNNFWKKILTLYVFTELYYYILYKFQLRYFNNLKLIHNKLSNNKLEWLSNKIKILPCKFEYLKSILLKGEIRNKKVNSKVIENFIYKNILFTNSPNNNEINYTNNCVNFFKKSIYHDENEEIRSVEINNDKLVTNYKSILVYIIVYLIKKYSYLKLKINGYVKDKKDDLEIFYKFNYHNIDKERPVILFFHGLGFGIANNNYVLPENYDIVMPEIPNISYSNYKKDCLTLREISNTVYKWLLEKEVKNVYIIGHSYGTQIINYFCNNYCKNSDINIVKKIYLEPVCFLCSLKNTYNLAYKNFKWRSDKKFYYNLKHFIFYYFVSSDIYFQAIVKRYESVISFYEYFLDIGEDTK